MRVTLAITELFWPQNRLRSLVTCSWALMFVSPVMSCVINALDCRLHWDPMAVSAVHMLCWGHCVEGTVIIP